MMPQETVMTLVNDCKCTETGECTCEGEPMLGGACFCKCECVDCETEYILEACACGGNCRCSRK